MYGLFLLFSFLTPDISYLLNKGDRVYAAFIIMILFFKRGSCVLVRPFYFINIYFFFDTLYFLFPISKGDRVYRAFDTVISFFPYRIFVCVR